MLAKFLFLSALLVASSSCYPRDEEEQDPTTTTEDSTTSVSTDPTPTVPSVSRNCTQSGLMCADCSHLVLCMKTANGYQSSSVLNCSEPDGFCSESLLKCSTKLSACSNNDKFTCHAPGFFPDPYDCNVYYECGNASNAEYDYLRQLVCPPQTAYNAATGECTLPITSDICQNYPVPPCSSGFSGGPLPGNANLYYICNDRKPKIYKCPAGQSFNSDIFACQSSAFHCPGAGTFADPKDCHKYYICKDVVNYTHHSCFLGFYFDERRKRCELGIC